MPAACIPAPRRAGGRLIPSAAVCVWTSLVLLRPAVTAPVDYPVDYHIDSWTTENGLPQNIVRDACQMPDGYLWLATMDGLVRFDGVRFAVFNRANTPGILSNRFTSLYCSANGELWAGTEISGVTRLRKGKFTTYTRRDGLPADFVWSAGADDAGGIWVLARHSIMQWDEARSRFAKWPASEANYNYVPIGRLALCSFDAGRLHIFVRGHFSEYPFPAHWSTDTPMRAGEDATGTLWLAAADGRVARWSGDHWLNMRRPGPGIIVGSEGNPWSFTYRDHHGTPWLLGITYHPGNLLEQFLSVPSGRHPRRIVFNSFFEDREGSIWLATDGQGLYRVRKPVVVTLSKEQGLPDRNIYPIYQDRSGTIWLGTWNGGLACFRNGKFTAIPIGRRRNVQRVISLFEDHDGALWVGTYSGLFRRRDGRFELLDNEMLRGHEVVQAIYEDHAGVLWFGTPEGLLRCQNGTWTLLTAKEGLAGDDTRIIIEGHAGNLWIGGYGGLTRLDHNRFQRWTEADGLPSNSIRSLYEDRDGVLWIGTYDGGLGRLENRKCTRYTLQDGLFNNGVFQILEDSRANLWMSCNRGIYRVSKKELTAFAAGKLRKITSISYGRNDGMRNEECNGGVSCAGIRARTGELWFPTQDGAAVIDAEHVGINADPPPVVIESISVDRQAKPPDQALRIPPGAENLQIDYAALSFIDPGQIRFKYQLAGLDRDWVDAFTRRTAYYTHLPAGEYDFRVIAANRDGVWNMTGKQVHISVLPPFYRAWWFLTLCAIAITGAVCLAWRTRVAQLERAQKLQEDFSRRLIASQESERKRIAAELHDSLGQHLLIINNWATLALKRWGASNSSREPLTEISTAALQALDEVRGIAYNLRPYQLEKLGLTAAIRDLINQIAAASSIQFTAHVDRVDGLFPKDVEIGIYRIVQEGLNNIVRHSQATEARITLTHKAGVVKLTIQDNGRGFALPDDRQARKDRNGFGLLGIVERARMLGGQAAIHSAPGVGTTIGVSLKSQEPAG